MGAVKEANFDRIAETYAGGRGAAHELFKGPAVMVAPSPISHLKGDYPPAPSNHKCKDYWVISGEGELAQKFALVTFKAWRTDIVTKSGKTLHCSACYHDRVLEHCEAIENVARFYRTWASLKYSEVATAEYKRLTARIRKHNQRNDEQINYTSFPLEHGHTIVLHDAPGDFLAGETLPEDRPRLYALVGSWSRTPKGKRAGRGFNTWGLQSTKKKKDKQGKGQGGGEDEGGNGGPAAPRWRVWGSRAATVARMLKESHDVDVGKRGAKLPDIDIGELLGELDELGRDYAIDGEIPGVTDKSSTPEHTTVKRDIADLSQKSEPIQGELGGMRGKKAEECEDTAAWEAAFGRRQ